MASLDANLVKSVRKLFKFCDKFYNIFLRDQRTGTLTKSQHGHKHDAISQRTQLFTILRNKFHLERKKQNVGEIFTNIPCMKHYTFTTFSKSKSGIKIEMGRVGQIRGIERRNDSDRVRFKGIGIIVREYFIERSVPVGSA